MRVLFVINGFLYGGAEKLAFDLAQGLSSMCEFVGVAALYRMGNDTEDRIQQNLKKSGIKTYIIDKKAGKNKLSAIMKLRAIAKEERVQLIHAHCSIPMYLGKVAGFLSGAKVVCTVHSIRGYKPMLEKLTRWLAHSYVSIGRVAEEYMVNTLGIPAKKVTRIYNAVDTEKFSAAERTVDFWKQWGLDDNAPVVVSVGRVVPVKNQLCLLKAINRCRAQGSNLQCAIVGGFDESSDTYKELQAYIQEHSLGDAVRFLGQQDTVQVFLQNSDCFVMTSLYEGLSVSFLEAVLCGVPIITTELAFVRELEEIAHSASVVPQDDDEALAEMLISQKYFVPSEQTIACFRQHFSLKQFVKAHFELYERLLSKDMGRVQ